jgi:hypothetical protein
MPAVLCCGKILSRSDVLFEIVGHGIAFISNLFVVRNRTFRTYQFHGVEAES